jgi:dTDP-4-amino-4,6-dideoxygalactose transaminase
VVANGYNYRMDELHAALGRSQLAKLPRNNAKRRALAAAYRLALAELPGWTMPFASYSGESACHLAVVVAPDADSRQHAAAQLKDDGIQTSLHYPCVADFSAFRWVRSTELERTREFASRALTLPLFPALRVEEIEVVCSALAARQDASCG